MSAAALIWFVCVGYFCGGQLFQFIHYITATTLHLLLLTYRSLIYFCPSLRTEKISNSSMQTQTAFSRHVTTDCIILCHLYWFWRWRDRKSKEKSKGWLCIGWAWGINRQWKVEGGWLRGVTLQFFVNSGNGCFLTHICSVHWGGKSGLFSIFLLVCGVFYCNLQHDGKVGQ